ncbi:MAG: Hydroxymethylglutaryl-CoA synthase [Bacteroidota bacterium]|jgi:hydroxymethylglutaryl-CoA synthase
MNVGIDSISIALPELYLPIKTLAEHRQIEADKLIKGLGLHKMAFPDVTQDVVTFAANATLQLIRQENLKAADIARIYVATESGVDSSKPIGSYVISLLESQLGTRSFSHCDTVDFTFACIGGVDALQSCIDFVRLNPEQKAIVVTTDNAKYDLASTGEYTQGAGALALLITAQPRILAIGSKTGVATEGVFDFFKPRRVIDKSVVTETTNNPEWMGVLENEIQIYKEQPVFDGQYSNQCYINRITEAYQHFKKQTEATGFVFQNWTQVFMHLPYCFQARRTFIEIYKNELHPLLPADEVKALAKSEEYLQFVQEKIQPSESASGQVGNLYTGSIFLGMLSGLSVLATQEADLIHEKVGFIAYGSGSKSKVFEGTLQSDWKSQIAKVNLFPYLESRKEIDFTTYEKLHKKEVITSVGHPQGFVLDSIEKENPILVGARYYRYQN